MRSRAERGKNKKSEPPPETEANSSSITLDLLRFYIRMARVIDGTKSYNLRGETVPGKKPYASYRRDITIRGLAREMGVSHGTVLNNLRAIEGELFDARVLDSQTLRLTEFGRSVLEWANKVINVFDDGEEKLLEKACSIAARMNNDD